MAFNQGYYTSPMGGAFQPVYQPQPMQTRGHAQDQPLFCRFSTNFNEVQACPVDFSGNPMTFLGPNLQKVWIKIFNPSTGGSDVIEYHPAAPAKSETPQTPTMEDFLALQKLVQEQGEKIARLSGATRRRADREQEGIDHEV